MRRRDRAALARLLDILGATLARVVRAGESALLAVDRDVGAPGALVQAVTWTVGLGTGTWQPPRVFSGRPRKTLASWPHYPAWDRVASLSVGRFYRHGRYRARTCDPQRVMRWVAHRKTVTKDRKIRVFLFPPKQKSTCSNVLNLTQRFTECEGFRGTFHERGAPRVRYLADCSRSSFFAPSAAQRCSPMAPPLTASSAPISRWWPRAECSKRTERRMAKRRRPRPSPQASLRTGLGS